MEGAVGSCPCRIELPAGGRDPNAGATPDSYFPLLLAAAGGWGDILSLLLFHGADVNASMGDYHSQRRTALMAATEAGQGEIVQELCRAGAGVNAPFTLRDGTTPLMMAAARGSVPLTTTLLGAGALVNQGCTDAMGDRGRGPLAAAAGTAGSQEVTLVLLGAGAGPGGARGGEGHKPPLGARGGGAKGSAGGRPGVGVGSGPVRGAVGGCHRQCVGGRCRAGRMWMPWMPWVGAPWCWARRPGGPGQGGPSTAC